jgi:hypothetical protein
LEDAKDRFDEQKIAAKKGNYQAAQAAGNRAADDLRQATQLTMTGAHYGNTEALNRYQTQQQGALGIEGLNLKARDLAQSGAYQKAQLAAQEKRFNAMDAASKARMAQVQAQQQQYAQLMNQRKMQNDAQVYQLLTQNMPSPVGYEQGPTSREAQTTMIGAGGDQGIYGPPQQQMSPGQIAQMSQGMYGQQGYAPQGYGQQDMYGQGYGPQGMPPQGMPQGQQDMPPQGITAAQQLTPQQIAMQRGVGLEELQQIAAMHAQQAQQMQQAPQTQQAPVMAAYGGIMRGYR